MRITLPKSQILPVIFIAIVAVVWIADAIWGDTDYTIPLWTTHLWFAEMVGFIVTGIAAACLRKKLPAVLPWILAGLAACIFGVYIWQHFSRALWPAPDPYNTPLGRVYYAEQNTIPYLTPFHHIMKDYSLFSDIPEFIETQIFVLVPLAAGYGYVVLRRPRHP